METKVCTKCGKELPATAEYFSKAKNGKFGLRYTCKECDRQYREENKERKAEHNRKYREENKERIAEYDRKYRENNKTKLLEYGRKYNRKYREENKEYFRQYKRKYREENKERITKYERKYYEENREHYRSYEQRRNSLKRNLPSTLTINQWRHAQSYFNHSCAYCGSATTLEQDHFWPLSEGGGYTATNIIPACRSCNASKSNKPFEEWYPTHESYSPEREAKIYQYFEQLALENGGRGRQRYDLGIVTI